MAMWGSIVNQIAESTDKLTRTGSTLNVTLTKATGTLTKEFTKATGTLTKEFTKAAGTLTRRLMLGFVVLIGVQVWGTLLIVDTIREQEFSLAKLVQDQDDIVSTTISETALSENPAIEERQSDGSDSISDMVPGENIRDETPYVIEEQKENVENQSWLGSLLNWPAQIWADIMSRFSDVPTKN